MPGQGGNQIWNGVTVCLSSLQISRTPDTARSVTRIYFWTDLAIMQDTPPWRCVMLSRAGVLPESQCTVDPGPILTFGTNYKGGNHPYPQMVPEEGT